MANFKLIDRDTSYLLPPSVDEWLPEDQLARFVVEIVDQLDLSVLEGSYSGSGSDAYHPRMLLVLLFYSYATGRQKHNQHWQERTADPGPPPEEATEAEQMGWRLKTPEGKAFYGRRKATVETVFGIIKQVMAFGSLACEAWRRSLESGIL